MSKLVASVVCSVLLVLGGLAGDLRPAQAQKTTDITFSLDFIVLGRHAPLFVAIEKGFYKEEGLNVTMIPAKGTAAAIQNVESKVAHLGFIDVPSLVIARAGGATVKSSRSSTRNRRSPSSRSTPVPMSPRSKGSRGSPSARIPGASSRTSSRR